MTGILKTLYDVTNNWVVVMVLGLAIAIFVILFRARHDAKNSDIFDDFYDDVKDKNETND